MEIKTATVDELQERLSAILGEIDGEGADLDALEEETRSIQTELETRKAAEATRVEIRNKIAGGDLGETVAKPEKEEKKTMDVKELRNSQEYVAAFAKYIKTEDATECRAILSTNAEENGTVPVPTFIEDRIRTAWEREGITKLVKKTYLKGNVAVAFELSAGDAEVHAEGDEAIDPEALTLGVVTMVAQSLKKHVQISDEVVDLNPADFLTYVYDEITYKIAKLAADSIVGAIVDAPTTSSATAAGQAQIVVATPDAATVATAIANLSDDAANPVIVMNKLTYATFKGIQYANGYAVDPFEGLPIVFNNTLPAYSAAAANEPYLIVGDFGIGAQANFPNGDEIRFRYDDLSLAEADLVKIVGRMYVGFGIVAPKAFCRVLKSTT